MAKDPVCQMDVDEKKAAAMTVYRGRTYYFCAHACKQKFDRTLESLKKAGGGICFGVRVGEEQEAKKD